MKGRGGGSVVSAAWEQSVRLARPTDNRAATPQTHTASRPTTERLRQQCLSVLLTLGPNDVRPDTMSHHEAHNNSDESLLGRHLEIDASSAAALRFAVPPANGE